MNELTIQRQCLDYIRPISNLLEVAMTVSQTKYLTTMTIPQTNGLPTLRTICNVVCNALPKTVNFMHKYFYNFLTSKRSCDLNDASYSTSQPSMHVVKCFEDLNYNNYFRFPFAL